MISTDTALHAFLPYMSNLNRIFFFQSSSSLSHCNTAMLSFVSLYLIQLTKQLIHMFQANTLCLRPK